MFTVHGGRLCVLFDGYPPVPYASDTEPYLFETARPKRVGDDAIIVVAGKYRRRVRLLRSSRRMAKRATFLVDMGKA